MKSSLLPVLFLAAACSKPAGQTIDFRHRKPEGGKPVASWTGDAVTDLELKNRFAEMSPYQRARYQTLEQKRDYVDGAELRDAETVLAQLSTWFEDYNTRAPHSAFGMRSPSEYRAVLTVDAALAPTVMPHPAQDARSTAATCASPQTRF